MFIICNIFAIHSRPEDQSRVWINMKHSEVREIPRECFLGVSGRSWTIALTAVHLFATAVVAQHPSFLVLYPLLAYAYFQSLIDRSKSEEWFFLACGSLGAGHALDFLATRWSTAARAFRTSRSVGSIQDTGCFRIAVVEQRGKGEIVSLRKKDVGDVPLLLS